MIVLLVATAAHCQHFDFCDILRFGNSPIIGTCALANNVGQERVTNP